MTPSQTECREDVMRSEAAEAYQTRLESIEDAFELDILTLQEQAVQAYLETSETVRGLGALDVLTQQEIVEALDPYREDPLLNPWRRGYGARVRVALDS